MLIVGLVLAAVGLLLLSRAPAHATYAIDVLPAFLIGGLGLGMAFVPIQVAAFGGVEGSDSGLAAGLINTSQEAGELVIRVWRPGQPVRVIRRK